MGKYVVMCDCEDCLGITDEFEGTWMELQFYITALRENPYYYNITFHDLPEEEEEMRKSIAVMTVCSFGGICILDIEDGIDTYVVHADYYNGKIKNVSKSKVRETVAGRSYFMRKGKRYHIDQFMRV